MPSALRVLLATGSAEEAAGLRDLLARGLAGGEDADAPQVEVVDATGLGAALKVPWQLVVIGECGPQLDYLAAVRLCRIQPDLPVVVFGGEAEEELAGELMAAGARDVVNRNRPARLIPAVLRELSVAACRRERRRIEVEVSRLAAHHETILNAAGEGVFGIDAAGNHTFVNPAAMRLLGFVPEELIGCHSHTLWHHHRPDGSLYPDHECPIYAVLRDGRTRQGEEWFIRRDGNHFPVEFIATPIYEEGSITGAVVSFFDLSPLRAAEDALRRTNRALLTLTQCNQAMVRHDTETGLLEEIVSGLVNQGGYALAWVGLPVADRPGELLPRFWAGEAAGVLEELLRAGRPPWETPRLAQEVLESGKTRVMQEYDPKCISPDWADLAARYGLRSSVALPLLHGGECYGVLCVHARRTGLFVDDELNLLAELAGDLAFGIAMVRLRTERDTARAALERAFFQSIRAAALTVEKRDPSTAGHQLRVSELSVAIARRLGLDTEQVEGIRFAAMVHDIGNIYVPAEILNRPGALSEVEFDLVKCHVVVGHEIVSGIDFPWPVAEMVLQHHERLDGSGYPGGLQDDRIVLGARIIGVADVVEAICSHRPFRPALGPEAALAELRNGAGILYDAAVVEVCLGLIQEGFSFG